MMMTILDFAPGLAHALPETHALLRNANLVLHPCVSRVVLHGSRGLAGGCRPDSDIDLSLLVDIPTEIAPSALETLLQAAVEITRNSWKAVIEPDLAFIFETRACGLRCFEQAAWSEARCAIGGMDCFGLYKVQKGFDGFVVNAGIQVARMYPCLEIWRRARVCPEV